MRRLPPSTVDLSRVAELDQAGQHSQALDLLHSASRNSDPTAMTMLGARLIRGAQAPYQPEAGARWLIRAGETGGPASRRLASALIAAGIGEPCNLHRALDELLKAAIGGSAAARQELAALSTIEGMSARLKSAEAISENALTHARRSIDPAAWTRVTAPEVLSESPPVRVYRRFIPSAACDWIRECAAGRLQQTAVVGADGAGNRSLGIRTARGAGFGVLESDVVMAMVRARLAAATGLATPCFEPPNVLHYAPGQRYEPHFDFFNTSVPQLAQVVASGGQRIATALIYLNDDYEGGETDFPELGVRFRGQAGDALVFWNVDASGHGDPRTVHAGLPPTSGGKWLLSQWIRDRPQPIV